MYLEQNTVAWSIISDSLSIAGTRPAAFAFNHVGRMSSKDEFIPIFACTPPYRQEAVQHLSYNYEWTKHGFPRTHAALEKLKSLNQLAMKIALRNNYMTSQSLDYFGRSCTISNSRAELLGRILHELDHDPFRKLNYSPKKAFSTIILNVKDRIRGRNLFDDYSVYIRNYMYPEPVATPFYYGLPHVHVFALDDENIHFSNEGFLVDVAERVFDKVICDDRYNSYFINRVEGSNWITGITVRGEQEMVFTRYGYLGVSEETANFDYLQQVNGSRPYQGLSPEQQYKMHTMKLGIISLFCVMIKGKYRKIVRDMAILGKLDELELPKNAVELWEDERLEKLLNPYALQQYRDNIYSLARNHKQISVRKFPNLHKALFNVMDVDASNPLKVRKGLRKIIATADRQFVVNYDYSSWLSGVGRLDFV